MRVKLKTYESPVKEVEMKERIFVNQDTCEHIWLSDLEGLGDHEISFVLVKIGDEKVEFDICTVCAKISRIIRNYIQTA